VTRIDAETGDARSERVGDSPTDMVVTEDAVWVADLDGQLYEVDASTMLVTTHRVGAEVRGVGVDEADGSVWVYVGDPVTRPPTEGP
jgi:hypothetical protein